ncbi:MAG: AtpZ/AtpI family protein [Thermoanaerobacteraceae bacterium]|nr:AtpZ/AtpI family protein [Thermoanaerobacteraceae bacterium]
MASEKGWGRILQVFALASTISVQFAVSVVVGWWIGHFFDGRLGLETPWLGVVGLLIGIGAGIYGIVRLMGRFSWRNGNRS